MKPKPPHQKKKLRSLVKKYQWKYEKNNEAQFLSNQLLKYEIEKIKSV
jgi:hypothetical protein